MQSARTRYAEAEANGTLATLRQSQIDTGRDVMTVVARLQAAEARRRESRELELEEAKQTRKAAIRARVKKCDDLKPTELISVCPSYKKAITSASELTERS